MISTRNPESMAADERRQEVAGILARGLLRHVRAAKSAESPPPKTSPKARRKGLFCDGRAYVARAAQAPDRPHALSRGHHITKSIS